MKLKEYMNLVRPGDEITCWDSVIDSEFYFYKPEVGEKPDPKFPNVEALNQYFINNLEVKEISKNGITLELYNFLDNAFVIEYAKEHFFDEGQYSSDEDVLELLFDDLDKNFSMGYENFSGLVLKCFAFKDEFIEKYPHLSECKDVVAIMKNFTPERLSDIEDAIRLYEDTDYIVFDEESGDIHHKYGEEFFKDALCWYQSLIDTESFVRDYGDKNDTKNVVLDAKIETAKEAVGGYERDAAKVKEFEKKKGKKNGNELNRYQPLFGKLYVRK